MTDAARVFISYAKEDERWLKEVTTHLGNLRNKGLIASTAQLVSRLRKNPRRR